MEDLFLTLFPEYKPKPKESTLKGMEVLFEISKHMLDGPLRARWLGDYAYLCYEHNQSYCVIYHSGKIHSFCEDCLEHKRPHLIFEFDMNSSSEITPETIKNWVKLLSDHFKNHVVHGINPSIRSSMSRA